MKITIHTDPAFSGTEVTINCAYLTPELEKIIAMLRMLEQKMTGIKDGEIHMLDIAAILYIDTTDKKTFLYTMESVYETELRLYELEDQLEESGFLRIAKSCIVNVRHITSLRADIDRKIRVTMDNGEQLLVSRQYTKRLKERLGI
ncbi:LytTR family DNA-binding domain-containing protein [Extibacter muris]|uniref:LytTR family DNA-binding domain-containing protein n=1 Tax=Extibacter muris TaxID=1796622 RepID=UPI001D06EC38|nr:LytTR family DNA-binding domain-containing protein [Extibacter muris]MCB6200878.1 LytTR family transcriptional regulator DNA-binding domain-containing protein [Extibacter muris]MCQ4662208.1 LytTR family transcriptional regulator DNA-binding domain-containing protein [Extibacter muris]MCQ4691878.1 LytTR family transcriptional regulator DNA-binding domain-containing protein [Extibacter muris]